MSKGSRIRDGFDRKKFGDNYDSIDWSKPIKKTTKPKKSTESKRSDLGVPYVKNPSFERIGGISSKMRDKLDMTKKSL